MVAAAGLRVASPRWRRRCPAARRRRELLPFSAAEGRMQPRWSFSPSHTLSIYKSEQVASVHYDGATKHQKQQRLCQLT